VETDPVFADFAHNGLLNDSQLIFKGVGHTQSSADNPLILDQVKIPDILPPNAPSCDPLPDTGNVKSLNLLGGN
jgi:hypothetical protein